MRWGKNRQHELMAYDIANYNKLGLLYKLLDISDPDQATESDLKLVNNTLSDAINNTLESDVSLNSRLKGKDRHASVIVREKMRAQW